jgi:hypothetical protein
MITAEIAAALGGTHQSGTWWRCRCPAHSSRGSTLALRDGDRGLIAKCFAGCDRRDILAALRRLGLLDGRVPYRPPLAVTDAGARDDTARRIEIARRIWGEARDARGTPVERYLAGRGTTIAPPVTLRWVHALQRPDYTSGPAMVARIDAPDGDMIGIHRTWLYLGPDGAWRRRERAMLGRAAGGAVRLAPASETILIGEGIETCLAGMWATALPGWAALSTSGMTALTLPTVARRVVILADHDISGAGERAAYAAADRWLAEGRRVQIALPPEPGTDIADVLAGRAYAEVRDVAA